MPREIALLSNPAAGRGKAPELARWAAVRMREAGLLVRALAAHDADESAAQVAAAVGDGVDTVAVVGGDGMVHLAAQSLVGTSTRLGVIPSGTGNDVARMLGLGREDPAAAAAREFTEELGLPAPDGEWYALGDVRSGSKTITVWAVEGDLDVTRVVPGTFVLEWPPRSGRQQEFPELDRVEWLDLDTARAKLVSSQRPLIDRLVDLLAPTGTG